MAFKSSKVTFDNKNRFGDDFKRFAVDEAARFTSNSNEAASASLDETVEHGLRFSKEKNVGKAKEQRKILDEIKKEKEELLSKESIHPSTEKDISTSCSKGSTNSNSSSSSNGNDISRDSFFSSEGASRESRFIDTDSVDSSYSGDKFSKFSDNKDNGSEKATTSKDVKEFEDKEKNAKKSESKETKKAAAKTALASVFKAKKELSNALASDKSTGDAMRDGNTGLMILFTETLNPMRYVKGLCAKIMAAIVPYILGFMAVFSLLLIIIAFLFSVLKPIADVKNALDSFISFITGEDDEEDEDIFNNNSLSQSEIDEIVAAAGADETEEKVIRYALSKVGYPYSQEQRCSGKAYDCSSLAYYAWKDAGVDISFGTNYPPTAAEGARTLESKGMKLETMNLKPGDLVYYGGAANGRYLGIYHVALYVGQGKAVEALNTQYGVVYQNLRTDNAIMVCRPN